jgi:hypothetical protein
VGNSTFENPNIVFFLSFSLGKESRDFYDLNSIIIRELIHRFNDENKDVVKTANKAFAALSKSVPAEVLVEDIEYMRNLIASMVSDARRRKGGVGDGEFLLPGFNIPKGEFTAFSFLTFIAT